MTEHRFEFIEHTADIGIAATGGSLQQAFENAAYGMFSVMADLEGREATGQVEIEAAGEDVVSLLQAWLSELLFTFEVRRVLPVRFEVRGFQNGKLSAVVGVRDIGPDIEWTGPAIKAVTFHSMSVEQVAGEWRAQVIFDV